MFEEISISKGWPCDKKYCAVTADGTKYLLRITPEEKSAIRTDMFRMQNEVAALSVPMCKPIEFGSCEEGVYSILSWIDGVDAEEIVPALSDTEQYVYGLDAGRILRKIHSIPAPATQEKTTICDIDFFRKQPYTNNMSRLWGSSRFQAPKEYQFGAVIDEVTNVYTIGATAFALFGGYHRTIDKWQLDDKLFAVVEKAVSDDRPSRQQSIKQLREEWEAALK